jgi:hypothetical protein
MLFIYTFVALIDPRKKEHIEIIIFSCFKFNKRRYPLSGI